VNAILACAVLHLQLESLHRRPGATAAPADTTTATAANTNTGIDIITTLAKSKRYAPALEAAFAALPSIRGRGASSRLENVKFADADAVNALFRELWATLPAPLQYESLAEGLGHAAARVANAGEPTVPEELAGHARKKRKKSEKKRAVNPMDVDRQ